MQTRRIANTDLEVSIIGLGTVKFGRNEGVKYPSAFQLPDDKTLDHLLGYAKDAGINLLDTAPAYGLSEARLGQLLKGKRHEWIIASKAGETFADGLSNYDFSKAAIIKSVDNSLKQLKTDYLDVLFIHSNGDDEKIIAVDDVFATLNSLKQAGKIRSVGMSTKTVAGGLQTIDATDIAMVAFNPSYDDERAVIRYAEQKQKSIFIKKAFASGHLQTFNSTHPVADAMQFIFNEKGVTSVIVGTINPLHLQENIKYALQCFK